MGRLAGLAVVVVVVAGCTTEVAESTGTAATSEPAEGSSEPAAAASAAPGAAPEPEPEPYDRAKAKSPWARAKVGDWLEVSLISGQIRHRWEVTALGEASVTFAMFKVSKDGAKELDRESTVDLRKEEKGWRDPRTFDAVTEVKEDVAFKLADREVTCLVVTREYGGRATETWYCFDLSLNGAVVKSIRDGDVNLEVTGFGGS